MLKAIRNLDYTILFCQDVQAQKHFYQHMLGFPLYRDLGEWVELQVGASLLALARRGTGYEGIREQHEPGRAFCTTQMALPAADYVVENTLSQ